MSAAGAAREEIGGPSPREGDNNANANAPACLATGRPWRLVRECAGQGHTRRTGRLAGTRSPAKPGTGFIVFVTITLFSVIPTPLRGGRPSQRLSPLTTTGTLASRARRATLGGGGGARQGEASAGEPERGVGADLFQPPIPGGGRGLPRARRPRPGGWGGRVSTPCPARPGRSRPTPSQPRCAGCRLRPPFHPLPLERHGRHGRRGVMRDRYSNGFQAVKLASVYAVSFCFHFGRVPCRRPGQVRPGALRPFGPSSLPVAHALFEGGRGLSGRKGRKGRASL